MLLLVFLVILAFDQITSRYRILGIVQSFSSNTPSMATLVQMAGNNICTVLNYPKIQKLIKNPPQDPPYDIVILEVYLMNCKIFFFDVNIICNVFIVYMEFNSLFYSREYKGERIRISLKNLYLILIYYFTLTYSLSSNWMILKASESPRIAVLKHKNTRAFIMYGGFYSTQETIYCGVPMIGIPLFGDQRVNLFLDRPPPPISALDISTFLYIVLFILRKLKKLLFGSHACAKKDNATIKLKKNK
ncbi:UDP-glucuronosyltransferase 2C1 [Cyphomyrmex costatus]|uniref:UDP-glucuronosyltransferase 2C1 n=1 Tax=Cyphomyrmex costatus TaxID=456900 RepID=A0A195CW87_9HYME|nr:UDP-glucuronosyltransferase 2C1 [Cyphomyrmex costatus]